MFDCHRGRLTLRAARRDRHGCGEIVSPGDIRSPHLSGSVSDVANECRQATFARHNDPLRRRYAPAGSEDCAPCSTWRAPRSASAKRVVVRTSMSCAKRSLKPLKNPMPAKK